MMATDDEQKATKRSKPVKRKRTRVVHVRILPDLGDRLDAEAEKDKRSLASMVELAIEQLLRSRGHEG